MRIVGISGSLRKASWNTAVLRAIGDLLTEHDFSIVDISDMPLINEDLEHKGRYPAPVQRFRDTVMAADIILIATPEYNASIPAPLKNAIDWGSRPANVFNAKPVAIVGVGAGVLGTARAQYPLRQTLGVLGMQIMGQPEVFIGNGDQKFTDSRLTDQPTIDFLKKMIAAFLVFATRVKVDRSSTPA